MFKNQYNTIYWYFYCRNDGNREWKRFWNKESGFEQDWSHGNSSSGNLKPGLNFFNLYKIQNFSPVAKYSISSQFFSISVYYFIDIYLRGRIPFSFHCVFLIDQNLYRFTISKTIIWRPPSQSELIHDTKCVIFDTLSQFLYHW